MLLTCRGSCYSLRGGLTDDAMRRTDEVQHVHVICEHTGDFDVESRKAFIYPLKSLSK